MIPTIKLIKPDKLYLRYPRNEYIGSGAVKLFIAAVSLQVLYFERDSGLWPRFTFLFLTALFVYFAFRDFKKFKSLDGDKIDEILLFDKSAGLVYFCGEKDILFSNIRNIEIRIGGSDLDCYELLINKKNGTQRSVVSLFQNKENLNSMRDLAKGVADFVGVDVIEASELKAQWRPS